MSHTSAMPRVSSCIHAMLVRLDRLPPRLIGGVAMLAGAFALGLALTAEYGFGLLPCSLCLLERWPYRAVIALGALSLIAPRWLVVPLLWTIVFAMLTDAGLAVIHVGVEQHFWQNPINECAAPHFNGSTLMDRLLELSSRPPQPCDRATYLIPFIPLSMAAMNALYAGGLAGLVGVYLWRRHQHKARGSAPGPR